jgi:hypothetical protein
MVVFRCFLVNIQPRPGGNGFLTETRPVADQGSCIYFFHVKIPLKATYFEEKNLPQRRRRRRKRELERKTFFDLFDLAVNLP